MTGKPKGSNDPEERIRVLLQPGETLLWCGRPEPRPGAGTPSATFWFAVTVAAVLLWGLAVWVVQPDVVGAAAMFLLVLPLLFWTGVKAGALDSRWPDHWRTAYAVTDRQALVIEGTARDLKVVSYPAPAIVTVQLRPRAGGLADVVVRQGPMLHARLLLWPGPLRPTRELALMDPAENPVGFFALADAPAAARALLALRAGRLPRASVPSIIPATSSENPS